MKKLFEAIMNLPDYTVNQLDVILKTDTLVTDQLNPDLDTAHLPEIGEALAPRNSTINPHVKKTVKKTRALMHDILNYTADIVSANNELNAIRKKRNEEKKLPVLMQDDFTPICIGLLPEEYTDEQYQAILNIIQKIK